MSDALIQVSIPATTVKVGGQSIAVQMVGAPGPRGPSGPDEVDFAGTDGAGLVGYSQSVGYATGTTGSALLDFGLSVKQAPYLAAGDATTNDTSAINTAIAAASAVGVAASKTIRVRFPDGIYMTDGIIAKPYVWLDFGNAIIRKRSNSASATTSSIIRAMPVLSGSTYYGTYKGMKITGGRLESNGFTCTTNLLALIFCEDLEIDGTTLVHSTACPHWAVLVGGRRINIRNVKVLGGTELFQDGIHIGHGQYINVSDCYIESGDDAIALGGETGIVGLDTDPDPIRYVNVSNITTNVQKAFAVKIYVPSEAPVSANWEVSDINVSNVTGKAGILRNGGVWIEDERLPAAGSSAIKRVNIDGVTLALGGSSHDGNGSVAFVARSVDDVTLSNANFRMTDSASSSFYVASILKCKNITMDKLVCDALPKLGGMIIQDHINVALLNSRMVGTSAMTAGAVRLKGGSFKMVNSELIDLKAGQSGITGTATFASDIYIRNSKIAHVSGAASGVGIDGVTSAWGVLDWADSDFSGCFQAIQTTVSNATSRRIVSIKGAATVVTGRDSIQSASTSRVVTFSTDLKIQPSSLRQIQITPTGSWGSATKWWLSAFTSTTFTITCDVAPGAALQFDYRIDTSIAPLV